jgi:hypothetical protein
MWEALNLISKKTNITAFASACLTAFVCNAPPFCRFILAEIKTMLGHQNFNTTLIYAEIPTEELRHCKCCHSFALEMVQKIVFVPGPKSSGAAYKY